MSDEFSQAFAAMLSGNQPEEPAADEAPSDDARVQAARAAGLPDSVASRLDGTSPDELQADAAQLGADFGITPPSPEVELARRVLAALNTSKQERNAALVAALHPPMEREE